MERGKSSIISTIVLSTIIVLTIIFIVIVLKTGGKVSSDIGGVDLSGGITMEKQMALTVNANLRSYMDLNLKPIIKMYILNMEERLLHQTN